MVGREKDAVPRLTAEEAERIAHAAAAGLPLAERLLPAGLKSAAAGLEWHFTTPTRGSHLMVVVDDRTGVATARPFDGR